MVYKVHGYNLPSGMNFDYTVVTGGGIIYPRQRTEICKLCWKTVVARGSNASNLFHLPQIKTQTKELVLHKCQVYLQAVVGRKSCLCSQTSFSEAFSKGCQQWNNMKNDIPNVYPTWNLRVQQAMRPSKHAQWDAASYFGLSSNHANCFYTVTEEVTYFELILHFESFVFELVSFYFHFFVQLVIYENLFFKDLKLIGWSSES